MYWRDRTKKGNQRCPRLATTFGYTACLQWSPIVLDYNARLQCLATTPGYNAWIQCLATVLGHNTWHAWIQCLAMMLGYGTSLQRVAAMRGCNA